MKKKIIRLFDSIDNLSQYHYNKISETKDLSYLLANRSDKVLPGVLEKAWSNIITERLDTTSHRPEMRKVYDLQMHILELSTEFDHVDALCFGASRFFDEYAPQIEALGYDVDNPEDLFRVKNQIKSIQTEIRELEFRLSSELNKGVDISFDRLVDRISDHKGYRLNTKRITVREWIAIEDNYLNDINKKANASN